MLFDIGLDSMFKGLDVGLQYSGKLQVSEVVKFEVGSSDLDENREYSRP